QQALDGHKWTHDYYYARFDGTAWHTYRLAYGGTEFFGSEGDYTGLVALDPNNPNRVVISTNADPVTGQPLYSTTDGPRHNERSEARTPAGGAAWAWKALTANSTADNLRPIIPAGYQGDAPLFWLRGSYPSYTDYNLQVVGVLGFAETPQLSVTPTAAGNE